MPQNLYKDVPALTVVILLVLKLLIIASVLHFFFG